VTGPAAPPVGTQQAIRSYLAQIAAGLHGPASTRRGIVAELGTGIADAADAHRRAGLDPAQAARAAIAEFGHPTRVAAGFRGELAAATARRTTFTLILASGPTVALWYMAALASHIHRQAPPWQWATLPAAARLATLLATIAAAVSICGHLFTLAATGRLTRWLPARPAASAAIAAGSAAAADVAMLAVLTILATSSARLDAFPLAAAGAASLARLGLATRAARTCLAIRTTCPRVGG
jgi:hypothetical protein